MTWPGNFVLVVRSRRSNAPPFLCRPSASGRLPRRILVPAVVDDIDAALFNSDDHLQCEMCAFFSRGGARSFAGSIQRYNRSDVVSIGSRDGGRRRNEGRSIRQRPRDDTNDADRETLPKNGAFAEILVQQWFARDSSCCFTRNARDHPQKWGRMNFPYTGGASR